MKVFVVLCIVAAAIYSAQAELTTAQKEEYTTMRDECMEKTGATMDMIMDARKNKIYTDKPEMGTYMRCMFEKAGFMDHDGTMHRDMMMKKAMYVISTEAEAGTMIDKCMEKTKDMENMEKKAYEFYKCFRSA